MNNSVPTKCAPNSVSTKCRKPSSDGYQTCFERRGEPNRVVVHRRHQWYSNNITPSSRNSFSATRMA